MCGFWFHLITVDLLNAREEVYQPCAMQSDHKEFDKSPKQIVSTPIVVFNEFERMIFYYAKHPKMALGGEGEIRFGNCSYVKAGIAIPYSKNLFIQTILIKRVLFYYCH